MKKKPLILIICAVFVVAAIIASLIFIFSGSDEGKTNNQEPFSLKGTWIVVANFTNDVPAYTDGQFMVFTDTTASMYKDANGEAFAESSYTLNDANQLKLPDISRDYTFDKKTNNCVRLYENASTYTLIVRNSKEEKEVEEVTSDFIQGKWNVSFKGNIADTGERVDFNGTSLEYYKSADSEPFATSEFTLADNKLVASTLGLDMRCYKFDDNTVYLVENDGNAWELSK